MKKILVLILAYVLIFGFLKDSQAHGIRTFTICRPVIVISNGGSFFSSNGFWVRGHFGRINRFHDPFQFRRPFNKPFIKPLGRVVKPLGTVVTPLGTRPDWRFRSFRNPRSFQVDP